MITGILLPLLVFWKRDHTYSLKAKIGALYEQFRRLASGTYGPKSFWTWFFGSIGRAIRRAIFERIARVMRRNKVETIYAAAIKKATAWM